MLNGMTTDALLDSALDYIEGALTPAQYRVCSKVKWHAEPDKLRCCESDDESSVYAIYGWVVRSLTVDPSMRETPTTEQRSLRATEMGFTVARRWPQERQVLKAPEAHMAAAGELLRIHDLLVGQFDQCCDGPACFMPTCRGFLATPLRSLRSQTVTPYAEARILTECAGWFFNLTVA
jgi:hypothetical protein